MTKTATAIKFSEGQIVRISTPGDSRYGQEVKILEIDHEDYKIRTEFGWLEQDQIEAIVLDGTVDGRPAKIDRSKAPEEPRLINVPLENLTHDMNKLMKRRDHAASCRGYWGARIKALDERIDPIVAEIRRRDDEAHGVHAEELPFEDREDDEADD